MRVPLAFKLILGSCALLATALGQQQGRAPSALTPSVLTLDQYIQAVDQTLAGIARLKSEPQTFDDVMSKLPPSWEVNADGKAFSVSTSPIRDQLQHWKNKPEDSALDLAVQYLELLREQASTWEQKQPDFATEHAALNNILARREFRNVHGETWMDRFKQKIKEWLERILGRVISGSTIPVISDIVVYGLIVIAVFALAFWMYRSLREETRVQTLMPAGVPVSAKEWPLWVAEARAAAARGDWANAVHLTYWAGISFLEAQGLWRADVARTPREYLRLLPASSQHQPVLRTMTLRLESVWYAMRSADETAFRQTLAELESLGCPCN